MYYLASPEVAGGLGPSSVIDRSGHPPKIIRLAYEFDVWQGDDIVEGFPCYVVTQNLANSIEQLNLTGVLFKDVEISTSQQFIDLYPNRRLPQFVWLFVIGTPGVDDFGITSDARLVISETALAVLKKFSIDHCEVNIYQL